MRQKTKGEIFLMQRETDQNPPSEMPVIQQLADRLESLDQLATAIETISRRLDLLSRGSILPLSRSFALDANAWAGLLNVSPRSVGRSSPHDESLPDCRLERVGRVRPGSRNHYMAAPPWQADSPDADRHESAENALK